MIGSRKSVQSRTTEQIEEIAEELRRRCDIDHVEWFPIVPVVELVAQDGFEVGTLSEMGKNEGLTYPDLGVIRIREDMYESACNNEAKGRSVMAHELGHFVLHRGLSLASSSVSGIPRQSEDSEWQADEFTGLLLAPKHIIKGRSVSDVVGRCGVEFRIAKRRVEKTKHR